MYLYVCMSAWFLRCFVMWVCIKALQSSCFCNVQLSINKNFCSVLVCLSPCARLKGNELSIYRQRLTSGFLIQSENAKYMCFLWYTSVKIQFVMKIWKLLLHTEINRSLFENFSELFEGSCFSNDSYLLISTMRQETYLVLVVSLVIFMLTCSSALKEGQCEGKMRLNKPYSIFPHLFVLTSAFSSDLRPPTPGLSLKLDHVSFIAIAWHQLSSFIVSSETTQLSIWSKLQDNSLLKVTALVIGRQIRGFQQFQ